MEMPTSISQITQQYVVIEYNMVYPIHAIK